MLTRNALTDGWTLATGPRSAAPAHIRAAHIPARVPGGVLGDLRRVGLVPDPHDGENEHALRWIGESDWTYRTTIDAPEHPAERVDLVFHGIDTVATILLDGREVARSENMHRTRRIPLPLAAGASADIEVRIQAPRPWARERRERYGTRPTAFSPLPPFIRKAAYDFGWDWGPDLASSGIWRKVEIEAWSTARLSSVRPVVRATGEGAQVDVHVDLERTVARAMQVVATVDGATACAELDATSGVVHLDIPAVKRWWPVGRGAQHLSELRVELRDGDELLDTWTGRIGFRDIVIDETPDADGAGYAFRFLVNDEPMFIRGVNWIPDMTELGELDEGRVRRRLEQAVRLGVNLVRVWGGGVFESDAFYDICDELGLLVWQDFLFACGAYPEEEPYASEVEAEARDNIARLMPHPSLALWNGNNENLWFWFLHDWETVLEGKTWGERFYFELLPLLVAELDPERFYIPGSPSSRTRDHEPLDPTRGVVHSWIPGDYREYTAIRPRFVSEFGFQGPSTRALFDSVSHESDPHPFSPASRQRQKAVYGTERIEDVMRVHFGVPADFNEWYWLAQLTQARAVGYGIDWFRSLAPWNAGTIVWQLNDVWPAWSWSMIDSAERLKPAAFAMRRAFADQVMTLHHAHGGVEVALGNESREPWRVAIEFERRDASRVHERATLEVEVAAFGSLRLPVPVGLLDGPLLGTELIVATAGPLRTVLLGTVDLDFTDADPRYALTVQPAGDGIDVTVTAETLLRDLTLLPDGIDGDAEADRNLITLLPAESMIWHVRTAHPELFDEAALRRAFRVARATRHPIDRTPARMLAQA
jgi:beta-mannosidase